MKDVFITENFLLQCPTAVRLYHDYARDLPIFDFHSHLPPQQIARDHRFANLAQIWLSEDHYKWRAMRAAGVPEAYCTGNAPDWEKFQKWADTVPKTLRSPLYHWTHLELKRPFGISDRLLGPDTAKSIWDDCQALLARDDFSCRGILRQMNVCLVCTSDDPTDSLEYHAALAADPSMPIQVRPTFRPTKAMAVESPEAFNAWVDRLAVVADIDIKDLATFMEAIRRRHTFFHAMGCRLSDYDLRTVFAEDFKESEIRAIFRKVRNGECPEPDEVSLFKSAMLYELALMDHDLGWTQQLHIGALRNNNGRMHKTFGPDAGCDSMTDEPLARSLARFLDRLASQQRLTKMVVYNLNPSVNELVATMLGNFQDGSFPGKLQYGPAWWFLDQKDGMTRQLETLSNQGLLSCFVGMVTDSRSFLSFTRHEYFRRILCNLLGTDIEQGVLPRDLEMIGRMVQDICYYNATRYFGFQAAA